MTESSADIRAQKTGRGALGGSSRKAIAQMGNLSGDREAGSEVSWGGIPGFVIKGVRLGAMNNGVRFLWESQLPRDTLSWVPLWQNDVNTVHRYKILK